MNFPPIPPWEGAHPIIVHLPIGALPVAGLLAVCAMLSVKSRRAWAGAVMVALVFGTAGTVLATMTGEATEHAVDIPAVADKLLHEHSHLADFTRNAFIVTSVLYAVLLLGALIWSEKFKRVTWVGAHVLFLGVFAYAFLNLANTGHLGGRLVHEYGVRAPIVGAMDPAHRAADMPADDEDDKPRAKKK